MAFLNGSVTCFTPQMTLNQVQGDNQEKTVDDISNGDVIVKPDLGFGGLSKVTVSGVYYTAAGEPYTKTLRIKKDVQFRYINCDYLEKVIFERGVVEAYGVQGFDSCPNLRELVFDNGCNAGLYTAYAFVGSPIEKVTVLNISDDFYYEEYDAFTLCWPELKDFSVYNGWNRSMNLYMNPKLTTDSIIQVFEALATVTDGQYISLPDELIQQLDDSIISIAVDKGWDVY